MARSLDMLALREIPAKRSTRALALLVASRFHERSYWMTMSNSVCRLMPSEGTPPKQFLACGVF
jgi:hypothetical protein